MNKYELYMGKLKEVELNYNEKINNALNEKKDLTILFNELKILRKYYNKKIKYHSSKKN